MTKKEIQKHEKRLEKAQQQAALLAHIREQREKKELEEEKRR